MRKPTYVKPHKQTKIQIQLPGWLKNQIVALATKDKHTLNDWITTQLYLTVREKRQLPTPPESKPLPTTADQIRAWALGERLLMPCGVVECGFVGEVVGGCVFCGVCGVRVG